MGITGGRLALWLSGVRLEVHGLEKIPHGRAAIYMPNHQSNCDPPAVISILPPVLVMAKQEFFRVPVLGSGNDVIAASSLSIARTASGPLPRSSKQWSR